MNCILLTSTSSVWTQRAMNIKSYKELIFLKLHLITYWLKFTLGTTNSFALFSTMAGIHASNVFQTTTIKILQTGMEPTTTTYLRTILSSVILIQGWWVALSDKRPENRARVLATFGCIQPPHRLQPSECHFYRGLIDLYLFPFVYRSKGNFTS